jgi:hypothetical protein
MQRIILYVTMSSLIFNVSSSMEKEFIDAHKTNESNKFRALAIAFEYIYQQDLLTRLSELNNNNNQETNVSHDSQKDPKAKITRKLSLAKRLKGTISSKKIVNTTAETAPVITNPEISSFKKLYARTIQTMRYSILSKSYKQFTSDEIKRIRQERNKNILNHMSRRYDRFPEQFIPKPLVNAYKIAEGIISLHQLKSAMLEFLKYSRNSKYHLIQAQEIAYIINQLSDLLLDTYDCNNYHLYQQSLSITGRLGLWQELVDETDPWGILITLKNLLIKGLCGVMLLKSDDDSLSKNEVPALMKKLKLHDTGKSIIETEAQGFITFLSQEQINEMIQYMSTEKGTKKPTPRLYSLKKILEHFKGNAEFVLKKRYMQKHKK